MIDKKEKNFLEKNSKIQVILIKYLLLIIILEMFIVFVGGYFLIFRKEVDNIQSKKNAVKQKTLELDSLAEYNTLSGRFKEEYDALKKAREGKAETLTGILPTGEKMTDFLIQISSFIDTHGYDLLNISWSDPVLEKSELLTTKANGNELEDNKFEVYSNQVTINIVKKNFALGSYSKMKDFLGALEHHLRLLDIQSFGFDNAMNSHVVTFKIYHLDIN